MENNEKEKKEFNVKQYLENFNITDNNYKKFQQYYNLVILNQKEILKKCTKQSIINCLLTTYELGLNNNNLLSEIYYIPYKVKIDNNNYITELQPQISYKGYLNLLSRTFGNRIKDAQLLVITNKHIYDSKSQKYILDKSKITEKEEIVAYYAMIKILNNNNELITFEISKLKSEIEQHRNKYAKKDKTTGKFHFSWENNFDQMALKTLVRKLINEIRYNTSIIANNQMFLLNKAYQLDMSISKDGNNITYIDNPNNDKEQIPLIKEVK